MSVNFDELPVINGKKAVCTSQLCKILGLPLGVREITALGFSPITKVGLGNYWNLDDVAAIADALIKSISDSAKSHLDAMREHSNTGKLSLDEKLSVLELKPRAFNILVSQGLMTVGDLVELSHMDVLKMYGMGKDSYRCIVAQLKRAGLSLKGADHGFK